MIEGERGQLVRIYVQEVEAVLISGSADSGAKEIYKSKTKAP